MTKIKKEFEMFSLTHRMKDVLKNKPQRFELEDNSLKFFTLFIQNIFINSELCTDILFECNLIIFYFQISLNTLIFYNDEVFILCYGIFYFISSMHMFCQGINILVIRLKTGGFTFRQGYSER